MESDSGNWHAMTLHRVPSCGTSWHPVIQGSRAFGRGRGVDFFGELCDAGFHLHDLLLQPDDGSPLLLEQPGILGFGIRNKVGQIGFSFEHFVGFVKTVCLEIVEDGFVKLILLTFGEDARAVDGGRHDCGVACRCWLRHSGEGDRVDPRATGKRDSS